jgi:hypothetical protein
MNLAKADQNKDIAGKRKSGGRSFFAPPSSKNSSKQAKINPKKGYAAPLDIFYRVIE